MWILLALLVAVGTSIQDISVKKLTSQLSTHVVMWGWMMFSIPGLLVCLMIKGVPPLTETFWVILAIDSVSLGLAMMYYVKALESADLSLTLPILSFTPVFMLVTSPLIVGEYPSLMGVIGVLLIVAGAYMLNFHHQQESWWTPLRQLLKERGARYMFFVAVLFSLGANFDKVGVLNSSPVMWMLSLNILISIMWGVLMMRKVKDYKVQIAGAWKKLFLLGTINMAVNLVQLVAITLTQVPYVIAVKRTSIILSSFYGAKFLGEETPFYRWIAIILMLGGIFLLSFFH